MSASARRTLAATFFALAAALVLALGAAQPAHAATSGDWGDCSWEVTDDTLTVKGAPGGALTGDVESAPWKDTANMTGVTKIVVGTADEPVKLMDIAGENPVEYLFKNATNPTDDNVVAIDLSYFDASNVTDMFKMFSECFSLTSLTFPLSFDTSQVTSMKSMFSSCYDLVSVDLSALDTSQVTDMEGMFASCKALASLDLSGFNTSQVEQMANMFKGCEALTSLDLSSFDTSQVTDMGSMFEACFSLKSLNLSSFNTSQVTNMNSMFSTCGVLESLDLSAFDTSQVMGMTNLFNGCYVLAALDLSNFNTSKVTEMGNMFSGCRTLTALDLASFNTSQVTRMSSMFFGCSGLTSLDLSGFDTSQVTDMGSMFHNCANLKSIDLSSFNTSRVTNMEKMFAGCEALYALDLSTFDTENVQEDIEHGGIDMFEGAACVAIRLGEGAVFSIYAVCLPNMQGKEIASKEITEPKLTATNKWIDPKGNEFEYFSVPDPGTDNVGWYLAQPSSGSYALFDWGASGEAPTFVPAAGERVTAPKLYEREAAWYKDKALTGSPVEFADEVLENKKPKSFYAKWDEEQTEVGLYSVARATYNGRPNAAVIKPANGLVGKATVTGYRDSQGTLYEPSNPPTAAGTYEVSFDCAAGPGYGKATGLTHEYVISKRELDGKETANLLPVDVGSTAEPVMGVDVDLRGGSIVASDMPFTVTATVTRPSAGTAGVHYDASVDSIVLDNANYDLAGVALSGQRYEVRKKTPAVSDFSFTPPTSLVYDGGVHKADVAANVEGMGAVTVSYSKGGVSSQDAPKDAGTYEVSVDVAESATYEKASGLVLGSFTIKPLVLDGNQTAKLPDVVLGSTEEPVPNMKIALTGGNIIPGDAPLSATATVTCPSTGAVADRADATVTKVALANANYAVASDYELTSQAYKVIPKKTPAQTDFTLTPPASLVYDGGAHEAAVAASVEGMGTITAVYYSKGGTSSKDAPKDAGTYEVSVDVAESDAYQAVASLVVGSFTVKPLTLDGNQTAKLPAVALGSTTGPVPGTPVELSGGNIIPGDEPLLATATVTCPSTGTAAERAEDATVTDVAPANANYTVPAGYRLEGQAYEVTAYEVIEGSGGVWEQGSGEGLRFRVDVDHAKFRGAELDRVPLVRGQDFDDASGSTIVTLRPSFLATLSPGSHTLRLVFDDGAAETTFTVAAPAPDPRPLPDADPDSGKGSSSDPAALAPTGDATAPVAGALASLLALAIAALAVVRRRGSSY